MGTNQKKQFSEIERNNYVGMICHWVVAILMILGGLLNYMTTDEQKPVQLLLVFVLGLFAPIGEVVFWKKDHETQMVKHFIGYGFAVFYTYYIFTSNTPLAFLFVVPLLLIITIYNDTPYTIKINIGTITESFILVILGAKTGRFGYVGAEGAVLQVTIMILIGVYSVLAAGTINKNLMAKMTKIQNMAKHTEKGIANIYTDMETLENSSENTKNAMAEVSSGTADTANAVQQQMLLTQSIGDQVDQVHRLTATISDNLGRTLECVEEGRTDLSLLSDQVDTSVETSTDATQKLEILNESMKQMRTIVKMIDDIAFQTNILALNANVEAARAGESGKGFAVVAQEVSAMSVKTKDATESIGNMIGNTMESLENVTHSIEKMGQQIAAQKESAEKSSANFETIRTNTEAVRQQMNELAGQVGSLTEANRGIMDSIQTISAASEEVSALANEAMGAEVRSKEVLDTISGKMKDLVENQQ